MESEMFLRLWTRAPRIRIASCTGMCGRSQYNAPFRRRAGEQPRYTGFKFTERKCYMTYYGPKEMAAAFRTVRNNTIKVAEEIPEESYGFRATPDTRTVAQTLVHIAVASRVQRQ